jgi:hypothetical protein
MSTNCEKCGYRDNEVKSGSAVSDQGKRITLKVEDREDLSRDILKVMYLLPCGSGFNLTIYLVPRAKLAALRFLRSISCFIQAL